MTHSSDRLLPIIKKAVLRLGAFTFVVDILLLVQPLYMLQIYDRILQSRSLDTLVYISIIAVAAIALLGLLDAVRSVIASRVGAQIKVEAGSDALIASMLGRKSVLGDVQPLRDLETVQNFIGGRGLISFLQLPFMPLFIALLFLIHPALFWLTILGAVILLVLAFANQLATAPAGAEAADHNMAALLSAQAIARNAESIKAMGMTDNAVLAWGENASRHLHAQDRLSIVNSALAGLSRAFRIGLQIAILGVGGYLVVKGEMTAGMIFASSLISGRALQPIDQLIGNWRGALEAHRAWLRLRDGLAHVARTKAKSPTQLPAPKGRLSIEQLLVMPPDDPTGEPLLKRLSAAVEPGDFVAIVGPSGAGKSTLLRTLVGGMDIRSGTVRIDGAEIGHWDRSQLGRHIGYLSQDVDLLPGTVAQNIARLAPDASDADIIAAARKAEVHELILSLPKGYDTLLGPAGTRLSGGQRQRIGLARAFFGNPRILLLDEPNANLDNDGELALEKALAKAKSEGATIVIVTQRRRLAEQADKLMVLSAGQIEAFGPRTAVLGREPAVATPDFAVLQAAAAGGRQPFKRGTPHDGYRPTVPYNNPGVRSA